jgi:hypothetical protein
MFNGVSPFYIHTFYKGTNSFQTYFVTFYNATQNVVTYIPTFGNGTKKSLLFSTVKYNRTQMTLILRINTDRNGTFTNSIIKAFYKGGF